MKKTMLFASMLLTVVAFGQQKKLPAKKPAPPASQMKNLSDSVSYAIGLSVANFYAQQGMKNINTALVAKAINDVKAGKALLDDNQANTVMMRFMNQASAAKSKPNVEAGAKFLAENKKRAGVKTTASGLQYEIIKEGTGPKPTALDTVVAHYAGTLINGTEFDNSYKRGEPITIGASQVIRGWTEGLQLMSVGSKYKFYIPYQLGYGMQDAGTIPAGSTLIFEVELLEVKGKK